MLVTGHLFCPSLPFSVKEFLKSKEQKKGSEVFHSMMSVQFIVDPQMPIIRFNNDHPSKCGFIYFSTHSPSLT